MNALIIASVLLLFVDTLCVVSVLFIARVLLFIMDVFFTRVFLFIVDAFFTMNTISASFLALS